jgi:hypothetical protein
MTITAVLPALMLLTACGEPKVMDNSDEVTLDEKVFPLNFKKEKEYRFDLISRDGPFFGKVEDKENLYVYFLESSNKNCEVLKLNPNLEIKEKHTIKRGAGPGEATNPRIYGGDEHSIIVYDPPYFKFTKFDTSFNLIGEYKFNKDMSLFLNSGAQYNKKHNLVIDGISRHITYYEGSVLIYKVKIPVGSSTGIKAVELFKTSQQKYRKDNRKMIVANPIHFGCFFDHVYILDKRTYRILKMDFDGNVLKDKKINFESRSFARAVRKKWVDNFYPNDKYCQRRFDFPEKLYPACWLMQVGDGIAVGRCENYDPELKGPVPADYFDKDLNYLGKIKLPYFSWWNHPYTGQTFADIKFYSKDGKLYFLDDRDEDEYWIVRYNIEGETGKRDG